MDDAKVLNADGWRYQDKFVQHKIPDAIGACAWLASRCWPPAVHSLWATP
jgi:UDP-3-O-acyl-N-acetylglucosamine deacetylase